MTYYCGELGKHALVKAAKGVNSIISKKE